MNKKGFTLVELLSTILILGIIAAVAGTVTIGVKKSTDKEEMKILSKEIQKLGGQIYTDAKISGATEDKFVSSYNNITTSESFKISYDNLKKAGYLKSDFKSPSTLNCSSSSIYLVVSKEDFYGQIDCGSIKFENGKSGVSFTTDASTELEWHKSNSCWKQKS